MSRMASIYPHPKTRVYYWRRRVPDRLRAVVGKTEWRVSLGTKNLAEAKRQALTVAADIQRQLDTAGLTVTLTQRQVFGLAADWMRDRLAMDEANPPDETASDSVIDAHEHAEGRQAHEALLDQLYGANMVSVLLTAHGVAAVDSASRRALVERLFWTSLQLWQELSRRAHGDYSPSALLERAPRFVAASAQAKPSAVPLLDLFYGWVQERKPDKKTQDSWGSRVRAFVKFVGHDDAAQVTGDDAVRWKDELVQQGKKPGTINDGYLAALRSAFDYGVRNKRLKASPVSGVRALVPIATKRTGRLPFSDSDAGTILRDARGRLGWRRWVPLLMAYTGARIEEVAGAAAADVKLEAGVHFLDLHPEGRRLKNVGHSVRRVPLHPAVLAEGFLAYVKKLPKDGPLFPDAKPDKYGKRSAQVSKKLGRELRSLGITDPRKVAGHSWRHRFADQCRAVGIPRDVRFALEGHSSGAVGDDYGEGFPLAVLHEAIKRLPVQGAVIADLYG